MTKTKYEVMEICNPLNIPVGPILSMKELAEEPSLRATGTIVPCLVSIPMKCCLKFWGTAMRKLHLSRKLGLSK